jgi:hypothetical protein
VEAFTGKRGENNVNIYSAAGNITQFNATPSYKRFYSEPAAFDGEPRRLSSDLKKVVVAQELNL